MTRREKRNPKFLSISFEFELFNIVYFFEEALLKQQNVGIKEIPNSVEPQVILELGTELN